MEKINEYFNAVKTETGVYVMSDIGGDFIFIPKHMIKDIIEYLQ